MLAPPKNYRIKLPSGGIIEKEANWDQSTNGRKLILPPPYPPSPNQNGGMFMFVELFKPGKIGNLAVKNRIFLTPMGNGSMQNPDGGFQNGLKTILRASLKAGRHDYYRLHANGKSHRFRWQKILSTVFYDKTYVNGAGEMCDALHRWGCKACIQLTPATAGCGPLWGRGPPRPAMTCPP